MTRYVTHGILYYNDDNFKSFKIEATDLRELKRLKADEIQKAKEDDTIEGIHFYSQEKIVSTYQDIDEITKFRISPKNKALISRIKEK